MALFEHGGDIYGAQRVELDFSVNTNPLGLPPQVRARLLSHVDDVTRYPDPYCRELRSAIAEFEGVSSAQILCGNGAADLIFRLALALRPKLALVCAPTFSEYETAVRQAGGNVVYHALQEENAFLLTERLLDAITPQVDLLFLCNPNNPTGRTVPAALLAAIAARCEKTGTLLLVDECFLDFTEALSAKYLLNTHQNLIILRAFTKTFCMAGLRLGYILSANLPLLARIAAFSQHWAVSVPAQIAGMAALENATDWLAETRRFINEERAFLSESLRRCGLLVYESEANFLLTKGAAGLHELLLSRGILTRSCENFIGLGAEFIRIALTPREQSTALLQALEESIYGKGNYDSRHNVQRRKEHPNRGAVPHF